jgi:hypothetical protein
MGEFIAVLFLARDIAHREHLKVSGPGSYARHMALGAFYEGIVDLADSLAEAYQGRHGIIKTIPLLENEFPGAIVSSIQKQLDWIEANRYKAVSKDDTALQNIIDEIVALYLKTLYKLKNLA